MSLNWLAEAVMGIPCWCWPGLVPREAQGAPLTGIAPRPCLAGEWEGGRAEWSFPLCSLQSFPGIMYFVLFGIALTDEKSNLKLFEILGLQATPFQWKSMDAYFNGRVSVFHGIDY